MHIKNISPYGDLDIPNLGRIVAAGEVVEVTQEQGELLVSGRNFEPVEAGED